MNKKILLGLTFLSVFSLFVSAAEVNMTAYDNENARLIKGPFAQKLKTCTPYTYKGDTFIAQIVGVKNRKCIYRGFSAEGNWENRYTLRELRNPNTFSEILKTVNYYSEPVNEPQNGQPAAAPQQ